MNKILITMAIFFSISATAQNCDEVKTGTYFIENESYGGSLLIRTESVQEEIVEKLGIHNKFDLVWTDDCNYVLYNKTILKGENSYREFKATDSLFVKIVEVTPTGYKFQASSNFSDFVSNGMVVRKN